MTSLAFLILSAMLLIHVVTAKLTERDLINAHIQSGRVLLQAVRHYRNRFIAMQGRAIKPEGKPEKQTLGDGFWQTSGILAS